MKRPLDKAKMVMSLRRQPSCVKPGSTIMANSMTKSILPIGWTCQMGNPFEPATTISSTALYAPTILSRRAGKSEISTPKAVAPWALLFVVINITCTNQHEECLAENEETLVYRLTEQDGLQGAMLS